VLAVVPKTPLPRRRGLFLVAPEGKAPKGHNAAVAHVRDASHYGCHSRPHPRIQLCKAPEYVLKQGGHGARVHVLGLFILVVVFVITRATVAPTRLVLLAALLAAAVLLVRLFPIIASFFTRGICSRARHAASY